MRTGTADAAEAGFPVVPSVYWPQLVAVGEIFNVVDVDAALGAVTLSLLRREGIALGPVIHDRRSGRIGFLVPPAPVAGTVRRRAGREPRHHGTGVWITLPPSPCPSDAPLIWLVPPDWSAWRTTPLHLVQAAMDRAHPPELELDAGPASESDT